MSIRNDIIDLAKDALNAPAKPVGVPDAERARTFAIREEMMPSVLVYWKDDQQQRVGGETGPLAEHKLTLRVTCFAKGSDSVAADEAADPMITWAEAALVATGTAFEALVNICALRRSRAAYQQGQYALCRVDMDFEIGFQSNATNPSAVS